MPRPPPGRTVLAVEERSVRLLQAAGGAITAAAAVRVEGSNEPAEAVRAALRDAGLTLGPVLVAVPTHFMTTRVLDVPSQNPREIRQIVELQVEKSTPHGKEEILSDFAVSGGGTPGYSHLTLAIAHQDAVLRAVKLAEALGGTVERVVCEVEGVVAWARRALPEAAGATLIVDVGRETTAHVVAQGPQLLFHRSVLCPLESLTASDTGWEALSAECQRSLEAYELGEGPHPAVQAVVLTGLSERVAGVAAALQQVLNVPVQALPALTGCVAARPVTASPAWLAASFAGLAGLAFGHPELDLTPPPVRLSQIFARRAKALIGLEYRVAALAVLLVGLAGAAILRENRRYAALQWEHGQLDGLTNGVSRTLDQLRLVKQRFAQRGQFPDLLETVSRLTPMGVELESLTYLAAEGSVVLRGVSRELPIVYEFVSALGASAPFQQVEARRVSKRKVEGRDVTDFEVACTLRGRDGA